MKEVEFSIRRNYIIFVEDKEYELIYLWRTLLRSWMGWCVGHPELGCYRSTHPPVREDTETTVATFQDKLFGLHNF